MCVNGVWGTVCNDFWDDLDARIFCRQLGHSPYGMLIQCGSFVHSLHFWIITHPLGALSSDDYSFSSRLQILLMNVSCIGNETSLLQCKKTVVRPLQNVACSAKAGVLCQGICV